ncbi:unnamed protein product, partial [Heterosigma akashiwo]
VRGHDPGEQARGAAKLRLADQGAGAGLLRGRQLPHDPGRDQGGAGEDL